MIVTRSLNVLLYDVKPGLLSGATCPKIVLQGADNRYLTPKLGFNDESLVSDGLEELELSWLLECEEARTTGTTAGQ